VTKVDRRSSITTLNISLPRSMRAFIMSECERLGFTTASEYMRSLVREAQQRPANGAPAIPRGGARQNGLRAKR
jgi:Arc/MetJ-type ribon-helix-helix transcriptional regulator